MTELTRFERTRLISARALQISLGAPPLVKAKENDSSINLAKEEFEGKVLPLVVLRRYPNGKFERIEIH